MRALPLQGRGREFESPPAHVRLFTVQDRHIVIIAGRFRGRRLASSFSHDLRPLLSRIRKSLFDILGERISGKRFLDLYSGTGAVGFEALSRGAEEAHFVENSPEAVRVIRKNIELLSAAGETSLFHMSVENFLQRPAQDVYDLIFLGPPYKPGIEQEVLEGLRSFLRPGGLVICQHNHKQHLEEKIGGFLCFRKELYGKTALSFYSSE